MGKKKTLTVKEKYDFIQSKLSEYNDEVYKYIPKKLFDRALIALLELKKCEEDYMQSQNEDLSFYHLFEDIDLEELNNFWEININNDKILPVSSVIYGESDYIEKSENDNSSININPIFDRYDSYHTTNKMVGIKFSIESQMGYTLNYTNVDIDELKDFQKRVNLFINVIEDNQAHITVKGCGPDFEFDSEMALGLDLSQGDIDFRTELLQNDRGLHPKIKVVNVSRDYFRDETWHVEGFEQENSELYKIKIVGYPFNFTFVSPITFNKFNKNEDNDEIRDKFLHSKIKEMKLPTFGHDFEDFTVEDVEYFDGGEIWSLGT